MLGMELYRSGILPQDPNVPVSVSIGGRAKGHFVFVDVRYPDSLYDPVVVTFGRK
jgi:hypothetical protein